MLPGELVVTRRSAHRCMDSYFMESSGLHRLEANEAAGDRAASSPCLTLYVKARAEDTLPLTLSNDAASLDSESEAWRALDLAARTELFAEMERLLRASFHRPLSSHVPIDGTWRHKDGGVLRVRHAAPDVVRVVGFRDGVELGYCFEMRRVGDAAWSGQLPVSHHLHPNNRGAHVTWTFAPGEGAFTSNTGRCYAKVDAATAARLAPDVAFCAAGCSSDGEQ